MINQRFIKTSNIPDFFGDFESLLRSSLMNKKNDNPMDWVSGLWQGTTAGQKEGYDSGFKEGTDQAFKSFLTSGDRQIFVTKNQIYPFSNVEQLYENKDTFEHIKDFVLEPHVSKMKEMENRLNELGDRLSVFRR